MDILLVEVVIESQLLGAAQPTKVIVFFRDWLYLGPRPGFHPGPESSSAEYSSSYIECGCFILQDTP
jgi:hypothetical protein